MPAIIINDHTWRQTSESIIITMPLVGHPKKVDLFAIDNYMKASYPPYILELFLWGSILEEKSQCTISDETAVFTLQKAEVGVEWPSLAIENLDKDKKRAHRSQALELAQMCAEQRTKDRIMKRDQLQKQAVRAQIDLDTEALNEIQAMKDSHRKEAMRELEDWRSKAEKPILQDVIGTVQENRFSYKPALKWFKDEKQPAITVKSGEVPEAVKEQQTSDWSEKAEGEIVINNPSTSAEPIVDGNEEIDASCSKIESKVDPEQFERKKEASSQQSNNSSDCSDSEDESVVSFSRSTHRPLEEMSETELREYYLRKEEENAERRKDLVERLVTGKSACSTRRGGRIFDKAEVATPRPRRSCTIDVTFSERHFPTPARESCRLEEQEWLEKQAEARRKSGFASEDLTAEEQDPLWLKDKGDEFFKAGNYLAAISAYTHGIKLSDKMSSLYVNRSAAQYAMENYRRCAEDCSTALELMVPKCEGNRESRARCHARLGAALCKMSAPQHGIPELEAALKLEPDNETIKRDLTMVKRYFDIKN